jgi:organic radical activating enzyme
MNRRPDPTARIIELFSSIQGEGIYAGLPHLFVRFWNCNMACHYCDTNYRGPYEEYTAQRLSLTVLRFLRCEGPFHAVSLTGGEPLLWHRFLVEWLPWLKDEGQRVYLETNGTLPEALAKVLKWVDIIAMDIKPPSATGDRAWWQAHEQFLKTALTREIEIFIKIVVTPQLTDEELIRSFDLVARVDPHIPLVLQPVTPWGLVRERPTPDCLAYWQAMARQWLKDVRIVPQLHRILGVP